MYKYINYEIIEVNGNDIKILCCRRYNHFYALDKFLRKRYPKFLIPLLPPKNFYTVIGNVDKEFLMKRKSKLSIYINFLFKHSFYGSKSQCPEFLCFLHDTEFNQSMYSNEKESFPESMKASSYNENLRESVTSSVFGIYSYFFK